jgi:hypothetical protein
MVFGSQARDHQSGEPVKAPPIQDRENTYSSACLGNIYIDIYIWVVGPSEGEDSKNYNKI